MEELDFLRDHRRRGTPCADRDRGSATEVPEREAASCQRPEHLLGGGVTLGVLAPIRFPDSSCENSAKGRKCAYETLHDFKGF